MVINTENLFKMGCNCAVMQLDQTQADKCLQALEPNKDYEDFLTVDQHDAFWNGYWNKPAHITEIQTIH